MAQSRPDHRSYPIIIFLLLLAAGRGMAQQEVSLQYTVSMPDPQDHLLHVVFRTRGLKGPVQDFKMPAWMPGYYQILDYAKNLASFKATDDQGHVLGWERT